MRVVVAGFGNVLRGDDGFGVAVAQRLQADPPPPCVSVLEVGIGGIHLVQELLTPVDLLVVVDAVELGRPPATVVVLRPHVTDVAALTAADRHDRLADMHYATPDRALMLARALGVLPPDTWFVGCEPVEVGPPVVGMSRQMAAAVDAAAEEVRRVVREAGVSW